MRVFAFAAVRSEPLRALPAAVPAAQSVPRAGWAPLGCRWMLPQRWDDDPARDCWLMWCAGCCLAAQWDTNGKDASGHLLSPSTWLEDVVGMLLDPYCPHGAKLALLYRRCAHGDAGQCKLCVRFYLHGSLWQLYAMLVSGLSLQLSGVAPMHDYGSRGSAPRHACVSDASLYRTVPYASHTCFQADFGLPAAHINV